MLEMMVIFSSAAIRAGRRCHPCPSVLHLVNIMVKDGAILRKGAVWKIWAIWLEANLVINLSYPWHVNKLCHLSRQAMSAQWDCLSRILQLRETMRSFCLGDQDTKELPLLSVCHVVLTDWSQRHKCWLTDPKDTNNPLNTATYYQ